MSCARGLQTLATVCAVGVDDFTSFSLHTRRELTHNNRVFEVKRSMTGIQGHVHAFVLNERISTFSQWAYLKPQISAPPPLPPLTMVAIEMTAFPFLLLLFSGVPRQQLIILVLVVFIGRHSFVFWRNFNCWLNYIILIDYKKPFLFFQVASSSPCVPLLEEQQIT